MQDSSRSERIRRVRLRDTARFAALFTLEHYLPGNRVIVRAKDRVRQRIAKHLRDSGPGRILEVERVSHLTPAEFRRRYLRSGVPVVLEGAAADWACVKQWSFDYFRQKYGGERIKLVQRKGLSEDNFASEREFSEEIVFGDFIDHVLAGGTKYMRFSPLLEKFPELLDDFDRPFFRRMCGNNLGISYQLFIGAQGTRTPLHNNVVPFFFTNIRGVKKWALVPPRFLPILNPAADGANYNRSDLDVEAPQLDQFVGFESVDRYEVVVHPGDLLFVPPFMWHDVRNLAPTIGVRCGFIYTLGMLRESPTLAFVRVFAARNPSLPRAIYMAMFRRNLVARDRWLLSPGWWRV